MSKFSIWIAQPRGWTHVRMFIEVARSIADSLRALGHDVDFDPGDGEVVVNPAPPRSGGGRPIIFAPHFLVDAPLREDAILFNMEQVPGNLGGAPGEVAAMMSDAWLRHDALKMYRRHEVWDYSVTNIERLRRLGVEDVRLCRVGFSATLVDLPDVRGEGGEPLEDIDVLFVGTVQEGSRRYQLYKSLEAQVVQGEDGKERPLRVQFLSGVYGADRNRAIARAKVCLNCHINEPEVMPAIFEVARCSYYFMNKKCVVTESGGQDPELEDLAKRAAVAVSYDKLVEACVTLVDERGGGARMRRVVAESGFRAISAVSQVTEVERALGGIS